ncbi:hypothetical protein ACHAPT_001223 [Fusarium lateritium]
MLALSSTSQPDELSNIVKSAAAVVFLGTPHHGSPELSALGAWARSVLSGFRFQTTSAILDTLGLKTTDLERSQEAFSGLWFKHGFRVKTFQEAYGLTKINLGVLGNKVVPDTSSLIGDQRERAETLQANHMEMCRFSGREDPSFVKVVGELRSAYLAILDGTINAQGTHQPVEFNSTMLNTAGRGELSHQQTACLRSLQFTYMHRRRQLIEDPAPRTGRWLIDNETYSHWLFDRDLQERPCILWLKGKPGAGKSTLMKQAFRHTKSSLNSSDYCVAGVFISAKGEPLEHSSTGVFRSLLHQLLPHYPSQFQEAVQTWMELDEDAGMSGDAEVMWRAAELKRLIKSILGHTVGKRTIIFIDGLDELDFSAARSQAEFWGQLSNGNNNGRVRVCLSSRHYPQISFTSASELIAEDLNEGDISTYVDQRLSAAIPTNESRWRSMLRNKVIDNAGGIFLWVTLTVDNLLAKYDQGGSLEFLLRNIDSLPWELEGLFTEMVASISPESRMVALRVFQWALMSTTPLRLHQWQHILAFSKRPIPKSLGEFSKRPIPKSLAEWRKPVDDTESESQLEREIKALSGGLLEVSAARSGEAPVEDDEYLSIRAGAGSLDLEQGDTRIVQVIHQSVREFFLQGGGLGLLDRSAAFYPIGRCHVTIADACLDYICIPELDDLVAARKSILEQEAVSKLVSLRKIIDANSVNAQDKPPVPEERNSAQDTISNRKEPLAAHLSMVPMADPATNIASWIEAGYVPTNPASLPASTRYANSLRSAVNVSGQLEVWPSLLLYALSSLATHLRCARRAGLDLYPLRRRLDGDLWTRFMLLKEDLPQDTNVDEFIEGYGNASLASSIFTRPSSVCPGRRPSARRAGSVASFASASSYEARRGYQSE